MLRVFDDVIDSPLSKNNDMVHSCPIEEENSFEIKLSETSMLNDMDLTSCVGGILSSLNEATPSNIISQGFIDQANGQTTASFNNEFEETQCVGGIIEELSQPYDNDMRTVKVEEVSMFLDMDLTAPVCTLIEIDSGHPKTNSDISFQKVSEMEMTACVGGIIQSDHPLSSSLTNVEMNIELSLNTTEERVLFPTLDRSYIAANDEDIRTDVIPLQPNSTNTLILIDPIENAKDDFNQLFLPRLSIETNKRLSIGPSDICVNNSFTPTKSVIWKICSPITGRKMSMGMSYSPITPSMMSSPSSTLDHTSRMLSTSIPMTSYSPYVEKLKEDISKAKDSPLVIGTPKWRSISSPLRNKLSELRSSPINESLFSSPVLRHSSILQVPLDEQDISLIEDTEQPPPIDMPDSPVLRSFKKSKTFPLQQEPTTYSSILQENSLKANLKQFLMDSGIRFLDNITSSTTRRETLSRSRESGEYSAKKLLLHGCISMPECELFEQSCEVLEARISDIRSELQLLEAKFEMNPPSPCIYFYEQENDQELRQQKIVSSN